MKNLFHLLTKTHKDIGPKTHIFYNFCSANQVQQSFKQKNKLNEFFKHVHPDILGQAAPERVREENSRSLKQLNSYLDSIIQNENTEEQILKFYCPEKTEKHSKKFYFFEVRLSAFLNRSQQTPEKQLEQTTNTLIEGLKLVQEKINPYFKRLNKKKDTKEEDEPYVFNLEDSFQRVQHDMKPIEKREYKLREKQRLDYLNTQNLFQSILKEKNRELIDSVDKELYYVDTPCNKPLMWSRIIINDSQFYSKMFDIFNKMIDPRLIYIDPSLTELEIEIFRNKFLIQQNRDYHKDIALLNNVFKDMESQNPQIYLYITKEYGFEDIPGFFSIPFKFEAEDFQDNYYNLKDNIKSIRKRYEIMLDKKEKLKKQMIEKYKFRQINFPMCKNEEEIQEQIIFLKKLQRIIDQSPQIIAKMKNKQIKIEENIQISINQIELPIKFDVKEFSKLLQD